MLKRHLGLWVLILFSSYLRRSRTALGAAVSPSPCAQRVRAHSSLEVPGPPGGAKPGFKEISAPASHSGTSGSTVRVLDEAQSDFPLGLGYPLRLVFVIPELTTQPLASDWAPSLQWEQSHSGPAGKKKAVLIEKERANLSSSPWTLSLSYPACSSLKNEPPRAVQTSDTTDTVAQPRAANR